MTRPGVTVLLVDDHAVVREGYRRLLEQDAAIRVVGEAADAAGAYRQFCELSPAVVVMDIALPGASGLEALRRMIAVRPQARVLMFSMYEDAIYLKQALRDGACGYLTKVGAPEALVDAVHRVAAGELYVSADMRRHLPASMPASTPLAGDGADLQSAAEDGVTPVEAAGLSSREFEILQLLVHGLSLSDIAAQLFLTQKTVANHQSAIKQKLGVENGAQLVLTALKMGLVTLGPRVGE